jgi:hypothetical protein
MMYFFGGFTGTLIVLLALDSSKEKERVAG